MQSARLDGDAEKLAVRELAAPALDAAKLDAPHWPMKNEDEDDGTLLIGALYTGRGPVCGIIILGGACCIVVGVGGAALGTGALPGTDGADAGGAETTADADCGVVSALVGALGRATAGVTLTSGRFAGTVKVGLTGVPGTTNFGTGTPGVTAGVATLLTEGGATPGLTSTGSAATGAETVFCVGASGCCLLMIALRTSPGLEM